MDLLLLKNSSNAVVAQLVEHLICNQAVGGSTPSDGTAHVPCVQRVTKPLMAVSAQK